MSQTHGAGGEGDAVGAGGAVVAACRQIAGRVRTDPSYAHTSHLAVQLDGQLVYDTHFRGPELADVFSVTKTVLATLVGIAHRDHLLPALDEPVGVVLPELDGTPAACHTWRQLLTMTRGSAVDGPWDIDEVTALPRGQVAQIASAPQLRAPGTTFRYDNGAAHLISAALGAVVGMPVADFAARKLFAPLGVLQHDWLADPAGISVGYAHLRLRAADLLKLGTLWLDHGVWRGDIIADPGFVRQMTSVQSAGGEPENLPYGYLTWVGRDFFLAGGWAGQHVLVLPARSAVIVTTGDPGFRFGPPPSDELPAGWRPALELVRRFLLPAVRRNGAG